MASSKDELIEICKQGMQLLREEGGYTQRTVTEKLLDLGHPVSTAAFSNILTKGQGKDPNLRSVSAGMQAIISRELGFNWQDGQFVKTAGDDFAPEIVPTAQKTTFKLHETGRLAVSEKSAFFKDAKKEVIEFGLTLSRFANNLTSGSKGEFALHVENLLKRGVHFKCYVLRTDSHFASFYFGDRGTVHPKERDYRRKMEAAVNDLRSAQAAFSQKGYPGKFEVFTYDHVPYAYFMAVDGGTEHCKMLVSPYLYGIQRSDTPVLEFSRSNNMALYHTYWSSLAALMSGAKRIIPA